MAAHADITCFSLGRKENSQRLWLRWDICPVEDEILTSSKLDFRSSEVSTGYPESLLTIIALLSAAVEDDLKDRPLDYISYTYLQTLSKEWKAGNCTENRVASIYIDPSETAGERSFVAWKPAIEFAIARWQPPSIPESLSVDTSLVLNTAWELIRKAALIYLWRGSFEADVLAHLPANHFALIDRFIREIYFTIPHHQTLEVLIRELWKQAEGRTPQSAPDGRVKLSLLSLAAESNTCLPLL
ncbi:hypothetical protein N7451_000225 [Penicillium sp. IBT 35674x]|nr:hypothetical protein N7451_000225 [Penicillium sp. IBT 35674x]